MKHLSFKIGSITLLYRQFLVHLCFFDEPIRFYLKSYIKSRFIMNRNVKDDQRLRKVFRDAKMALISLRKAIAGDLKSFEKILDWTYGRRGKRKHELLRVLYPVE